MEARGRSACRRPAQGLLTLAATALRAFAAASLASAQWGVTQLHVRGKEFQLKRIHLMPLSKPEGTATTAAATPATAAS